MANISCSNKIECECTDDPFANLTSENPDSEVFIADHYGWSWVRPNLGSNWTRNSCLGVCTSLVNQAEADLCAAINEVLCLADSTGVCPDCTGSVSIPAQKEIPGPVYYNTLATAYVECPDGSLFGYQVAAGLFAAKYQALADQIAATFAMRLARQYRVCLGDIDSEACLGQPYTDVLTSSTTAATATFEVISGSLPAGLGLVPYGSKSVRITGEPSAAGASTFTIRVVDSLGFYMERVYSINVLGITNSETLPNGTENSAYTQLLASSGGTAPYSYAVVAGALPGGLTLDPAGLIQGSPNEFGDFTFTIEVTDSAARTCQKEFYLTIDESDCPDWSTMAWTAGSDVGTITSRSFVGGAWSHRIDTPPVGLASIIGERGTLTYTGAGCNCQVEVTWDKTNFTETGDVGFEIWQGATMLIRVLASDLSLIGLSGTTSFPFTLVAGVGADQNILVKGVSKFGQDTYSRVSEFTFPLHSYWSSVISNV